MQAPLDPGRGGGIALEAVSEAGQGSAATRIMRKDAGTMEGELQEHSVAIGSQGHAIDIAGSLQRIPVQEHSLLTFAEDDHMGTPKAQAVQESFMCDQCTVTIQIATTSTVRIPNIVHKTMKIQACVDKENPSAGFSVSGCTTSGDAADICVHSQNEAGGVRMLKDKRGNVVAYGSCCSPDSADQVAQVSVVHCEPPPKLDLSIGTDKKEELVTSSEDTQMSQDAIVAAPGIFSPPGNRSWGGIWDAWPENATSAEQGFVLLPRRLETIIMLMVCLSISMVAIISSVWLMLWHVRLGSRITGGIFKLHPSSAAAIGLLWPLPVFSMLGFVTLMLPELAIVWQFLEALLVAATLRKMPDMFLSAVGGQLYLELSHRSRQDDEVTREELPIFTQWPFCCMRRCVRSKVPEMKDISRLQWVVVLLCFTLPILSFTEMFFALEVVLGPPATQIRLINVSPMVMTILRCSQVLCLSLGIASVTGLEMAVTSLTPKASSSLDLDFKSMYCQIFLGGLRLLPLICSIAPLWGLGPLVEGHGAAASRGATVSAAAVICSVIAWRAFPLDSYESPPPSASSESSRLSESASCKRKAMTPVLDQVKYCPFCGFSELELEASQALSDCAVCPRCCAHNVPVHLVVRRGGQEPLATERVEARSDQTHLEASNAETSKS